MSGFSFAKVPETAVDAQDAARPIHSKRKLLVHPVEFHHGFRPWQAGLVFNARRFDIRGWILRNVCGRRTGRRSSSSPVGKTVPNGDPNNAFRNGAESDPSYPVRLFLFAHDPTSVCLKTGF